MARNIRSTKIYRKDGHSNCLLGVMNQLRNNSLLCDVTLVTGDGEILSHKTILAAFSPYFYTILTNCEENYKNKVTLKGIDLQTLRSILEYIYTSEVKVTQKNVLDILVAANLLQMNGLRDFCLQFLKDSLNSTNCLEIWANANLHDFEDLLKDAEDFILANFTDVAKSQAFLQLSNEEVSGIISRNELTVPTEAEVFESVLAWSKHDLELRQRHFVTLMENIRICWLPKKYITDTFLEEPLLKDDPECKDFIIEALKCLIPNGQVKMPIADVRRYLSKGSIPNYGLKTKILLVAGGYNYSSSSKSVEYYCFKKKAWSKLANMNKHRSGAGATVLNGNIYIVGGRDVGHRVDIYDAAIDRWIPSIDMKFYRQYPGVATLKNCIYAVGGYYNGSLNTVEKFSPETKQWEPVARLLIKRYLHGVGVIDDILYAVGGLDGSCLNSLESYNPTTNKWTYMKNMHTKRYGVGVGVLNGMLYVVGGNDGSSHLKLAEVFDPKTGNWTMIKDMHNRRYGAAVVAANDLLYVVGGCGEVDSSTSVEVYDPKTMTWSVQLLPSCMNVERYNHCAAILDKTI